MLVMKISFTYGDGVADINIDASIKFHRAHGKKITNDICSPDGRLPIGFTV